MADLYKHIEALGKERGYKNITVLCKAAGVPRSTMSELNNGRSATISTATAKKFADLLGVSIAYLLGEEKKPSASEDEELWELRQALHDRPELKVMFDLTKNATPAKVKKMLTVLKLMGEDDEYID